jgi:hypothetical protein
MAQSDTVTDQTPDVFIFEKFREILQQQIKNKPDPGLLADRFKAAVRDYHLSYEEMTPLSNKYDRAFVAFDTHGYYTGDDGTRVLSVHFREAAVEIFQRIKLFNREQIKCSILSFDGTRDDTHHDPYGEPANSIYGV